MPPTLTFLSYARSDEILATFLERTLNERGVRLWRDIHSLPAGPTLETIEAAIGSCNGFVIVATRNAASSPTIREKELPVAARFVLSKPGFFLIPAFGMSPSEASEAFRGCIDVPLSAYSGVVLLPPNSLEQCRELSRLAFERLFPTLPNPVPLYATSRYRPPADIPLDFTGCLERGSHRIKADSFQRALVAGIDIHNRLAERSANRAVLQLKVHLPIAVALGMAFPVTGAIGVSLENGGAASSGNIDSSHVRLQAQEGSVRGQSIEARISLSQDVSHSARSAMAHKGLTARAVLDYSSEAGIGPGSLPSHSTELLLAREISADLKAKVRSFKVRDLHLFLSSTVSFAFILGQHLSATANIIAYDFDATTTEAYPVGSSGANAEASSGSTE
jgi:SMODS-associated and fused to various effectors sensor domain/TIR domain